MIDHCSYFMSTFTAASIVFKNTTQAVVKFESLKKFQAWKGNLWANELCDTIAAFYQLNYQANWDL